MPYSANLIAPMAGCLSGEDLEELVDDVLGCMDENAANYEENATAELVETVFTWPPRRFSSRP